MAQKPVIGIDLDGTVLDCRPRQEAVTLHLIPKARSHADDLWALKRDGLSTRAALEKLNIAIPATFADDWINLIEADDYLTLDQLLPDTQTALQHLAATADLHLITSRQRPRGVHTTLTRLTLTNYFARVIVVPPGTQAIADKAAHLRAAQAIAHCGDTEVDGQAASAADIPFWAVTSGQRNRDFLRTHTRPAMLLPHLQAVAKAHART